MKQATILDVVPAKKYTRQEAAAILGVKAHRIDDYARQGYLNFTISLRTGRRIFTGRHIMEFYNKYF